MSVQQLVLGTNHQYQQSTVNTGPFTGSHQGDNVTLARTVTPTATTRIFGQRFTVNGGATQQIDLSSLVDLYGAALAFGTVYSICVQSRGQPFQLKPDAVNGFPWRWVGGVGTGGETVAANGQYFGDEPAGIAVTAARILDLKNTGGAPGDYDVLITGSV